AIGLWYLRRGQFIKARDYLKKAVKTVTERNPNPYDGEALYNLGVTYCFLGQHDEAYKYFYKSVWNAAWMDSGYFQVARIDVLNGRLNEALDAIDRSILRNWHNHKARQLKTSILRYSGKTSEALTLCDDSLAIDRFNFSLYFEKYKLSGDKQQLEELNTLIRGNIHNYIEFALDYAGAGLFSDALELVSIGISVQEKGKVYPMALYYKAWFEMKTGMVDESMKSLKHAASVSPDYCFPNQPESVVVLDWAIHKNPGDFKALYYLGNFWYANKNYPEAIACLENSVMLNGSFPTSHRNLALACFNKLHDHSRVLELLEKAFSLDTTDARILMELDQLKKRLNRKPDERLAFLQKYPLLVNDRDDLYLELVSLNNNLGEYEKAFDLIMSRKFHPWEGGEGKVTSQYIFSLVEMAKQAIRHSQFDRAVELLSNARKYPESLGEGKLQGAKENELFFWLGEAYNGLGDSENATAAWKEATVGLNEVSAAMFYNDQQPDITFYQGLALRKLGKEQEASECFKKLVDYGEAHLNDHVEIDYFAVSLPDLLIWEDDLDKRNNLLCKYLIGLGEMGLGNKDKSRKMLQEALNEDLVNLSVLKHLDLLPVP
ncbi:MAG: tetratricopeptide repeat protein, partial [Bacteroidales bacterium]|nr:tetratricopeptide repeat protein [Bacteroidales bacterium]